LRERVFDIDRQHCRHCGACEFRFVAAVLERPVVEWVLGQLGLDPQPPPKSQKRKAALPVILVQRLALSGRCGRCGGAGGGGELHVEPPPRARTAKAPQKKAIVRTSMLSRRGASGAVSGCSKALWPMKRERPSVSES